MADLSLRKYFQHKGADPTRGVRSCCAPGIWTISLRALISPIRIIHISDPHFSDFKYYLNTPGPLGAPGIHIQEQDSVRRSNTLADFIIKRWSHSGTNIIVITGDLTDSGDEGDYLIAKDFIDKLEKEGFDVYSVPGNHDYCKMGTLVVGDLIKSALKSAFCYFPPPPLLPCPPYKIPSPQTNDCPHTKLPLRPPVPPWDTSDCPINLFFKDAATNHQRRQRFIDKITGYRQYPYVKDLGNGLLILLDSMQAELDENTGDMGSEGKLGDAQLYGSNGLFGLYQHVELYQPERKNGKKLIVCLHHSPFGDLKDATKFLDIVDGKIDCLLFGHTTPPDVYQKSFDNMRGIPLINCENLQNVPDDGSFPITVLDLGSHRRIIYHTGLK